MAIEKQMKTRIVLTHDEYNALKGKTLKYGEVVLAKVGNTEANGKVSEPIWMMKVGKEGNATTVENCPWLVAPAADVYEWAKKSSLDAADVPTLEISKINGLTAALAGKADADHNHDDVYKKLQTAVAESGAADKTLKISQNANGEITVTPVDIAIAQTQVAGLVDALAGKADDDHNHKAADLTDFTADVTAVVNGLGITTEGVQDLANRLGTAEGEIDALQTAVTTTLPAQIATKVEQEAYNTKVAALEKADSDLDTAVKAAQKAADDAQKDIDTFMGTVASSTDVVDTLQEIIALIESEDAELSTALMNEINGLKAKFNADGEALEAVNADTVDGKHADDFATAAQGATADQTAATVATYGDIVTHNVAEFATKAQGDKADTALQAADIVGKADKVTGATSGNFAGLDANGNLTDSGKKASDFAEAGHKHVVADITDYATDVAAKIKVETDAREEAVEDLQGQIDAVKGTADTAVQGVAVDAATGLKVTTENNVATISFIDDVVFVLYGGTAADLT